MLFFFFQAEDGIRDVAVTGVQTCALPISLAFSIQNLHIGKWLEVLPGVAKESEVESQNLLVTIHAGGHIRRCGLAALIVKHEGNGSVSRSEEHTSELQSRPHLLCRLLLENTTTT